MAAMKRVTTWRCFAVAFALGLSLATALLWPVAMSQSAGQSGTLQGVERKA